MQSAFSTSLGRQRSLELQAIFIYIVNSRSAGATSRDLVSKISSIVSEVETQVLASEESAFTS